MGDNDDFAAFTIALLIIVCAVFFIMLGLDVAKNYIHELKDKEKLSDYDCNQLKNYLLNKTNFDLKTYDLAKTLYGVKSCK